MVQMPPEPNVGPDQEKPPTEPAAPAAPARAGTGRLSRWRFGVPLVCLAAGLLLAATHGVSGGDEIRRSDAPRLVDLVREAQQSVDRLVAERDALSAEVDGHREEHDEALDEARHERRGDAELHDREVDQPRSQGRCDDGDAPDHDRVARAGLAALADGAGARLFTLALSATTSAGATNLLTAAPELPAPYTPIAKPWRFFGNQRAT